MLDPKDFLSGKTEEVQGDTEDIVPITGTFFCQHCRGMADRAQINLATNKIKYMCPECETVQEAKL